MVNGKPGIASVTPGTFATIQRGWKTGDRVELHLPTPLRLEAVDPEHPHTVALLCGPLVLFAITEGASNGSVQTKITRAELLAAKAIAPQTWRAQTSVGPLALIPFTAIDQQPYSAYVAVDL
jgi:hypothetical protein